MEENKNTVNENRDNNGRKKKIIIAAVVIVLIIAAIVVAVLAGSDSENEYQDIPVVTEVVTDEAGEPVTDENGEQVTVVVSDNVNGTGENQSSNSGSAANANKPSSAGNNASSGNNNAGSSSGGNNSGGSASGNGGSNNTGSNNTGSNNGGSGNNTSGGGSNTTEPTTENDPSKKRAITIKVVIPAGYMEDTLEILVNGKVVITDKITMGSKTQTLTYTTDEQYLGEVVVSARLVNYGTAARETTVSASSASVNLPIGLNGVEEKDGFDD